MTRLITRIVIGVYLAWLVLTLLIAMPALNFLAPWFMQTQYGRELRTDIILVNPFTLAVEVRGADLHEPDGSPFATLDMARVNLSLESLLGRALVFDDITLAGLDVHLRRLPDETLNIDDLLETGADEAPAPAEEPASIPRLTIAELHLHASRIALTDEARETPFHTQYDDLSIDVIDLSTVMEDGKPYEIDVFAESGGSVHWRGEVSLPAASSEGRLEVHDLSLVTFWRFAEPWLNFELVSGALNLEGDYAVSWSEEFRYSIKDGGLSLDGLDIQPRDPATLADTRVQLGQVAATGIFADSDTTEATVAAVVASGLDVAGWSEGDTFSLVQMFDMSGLPASESEDPPPEDEESGQDWTARVGRVALEDSRARWRSEYTDPPLLAVDPLRAEVRDLRWPLAGDSPVALDLVVNGQTILQVDGTVGLGNGAGEINYELADLPLSWANPNLPEALKATITDGALQVEGEVRLADFLPSTIAMDGVVTNFAGHLIDAEAEEALTSWDSVRWQQLLVDLDNRKVSLSKLLISNYEGRIHIAEDGTINASNVWQAEVGSRAEEVAHELELDTPWEVNVPEILISGSAIDFKDESLPLPFRTVIGDVNGEILDISTDPAKRASVDIEGAVDGYAPVTLKGTAAPLLESPALDLVLTFNGVDLVLLTPYSGTYAGYAIERGLLNMTLDYTLEEEHLKGRNDIVIDQLKLGEKVESDKALDLPIELALALLTDINGIIDLKVPVEGDVNDPKFGIGSVVADAIVNLITKAVTAPFALLANLVGSEDDLQRLPFAVGSAQISDSGLARLDQLANALEQRPQLVLVVRGRVNRAADTEGLQEIALSQQLLEQGLSQASIDSRDPDYLQAIERRYAQLGSGDAEASFNTKYRAVLSAIPVDKQQLEQLVQARAVAVKEHLVNNRGLPADRAAIELTAIGDGEGYSGVELDLTN